MELDYAQPLDLGIRGADHEELESPQARKMIRKSFPSGTFSDVSDERLRLAVVVGGPLEPHLLVLAALSLFVQEFPQPVLLQVGSDEEAAAMVLDGRADAACGGYLPLLQHFGGHLKVLCSASRSSGKCLVSSVGMAVEGSRWAINGSRTSEHLLACSIADALCHRVPPIWIETGSLSPYTNTPESTNFAALDQGTADCALICIGEAWRLRDASTDSTHCHIVADVPEMARIVPVQPHAVLYVNEAFERQQPRACLQVCRGLLRASRQLHENLDCFAQAAARVTGRSIPESDFRSLWQQLAQAQVFAVNGALSRAHWGPRLERAGSTVGFDDLVSSSHLQAALERLGRHPTSFDEL